MSCGCKGRPVGVREAIEAARKSLSVLGSDGVPDDAVESNASQCRDCPSRVRRYGVDWCGDPMRRTDTTCGCIVYVKIRTPGEECPQGRWSNDR